ncbi:MAG: hypothetical protein ACI4UH_00920 [Dorea sp.]
MSQAKVDKYKKEKANRKEIMRKEKLANTLRKCVVGVVGLVLVGWIGVSAYGVYEDNQPKTEVEIDYTAIDNLSTNLASLAE